MHAKLYRKHKHTNKQTLTIETITKQRETEQQMLTDFGGAG